MSWALGLILYEMVLGSNPFVGNSIKETFENIRDYKVNLKDEVRRGDRKISREFEKLLEFLLHPDPALRYDFD